MPKQVGKVAAIANLATGGAVALTAPLVIEQLRAMTINQTAIAQTITLPAPSDTSIIFAVDVLNIGTASFTMYGVVVPAAGSSTFHWNGTAWTNDAAAAAVPTVTAMTPTALNTVPTLAAPLPKAGYPIEWWVNNLIIRDGDGISINIATGAVTVTAATLGYNLQTTHDAKWLACTATPGARLVFDTTLRKQVCQTPDANVTAVLEDMACFGMPAPREPPQPQPSATTLLNKPAVAK